MKLLIITQKVDRHDGVLGFFHRWLEEFAGLVDKVTVITLYKGEYNLPKNVEVLSLGKEEGKSKITYFLRFFGYILNKRKSYDAVFVHMNPEYVILGALLWKISGKKIGLWYTHGMVDLKLRVAERLADVIFTASPSSFRLPSKKVVVTGHGIDVDFFSPGAGKKRNDIFKIVSIGRISPVKDYETIINSVKNLGDKKVFFYIIGDIGIPSDSVYLEKLRKFIKENGLSGNVRILPPALHSEIPNILRNSNLFTNASRTGSLDKAVLEAMSCDIPVLTSNEAFKETLEPLGLFFEPGNHDNLSLKIKKIRSGEIFVEKNKLRSIVVEKHNLKNLTVKIVRLISNYETGK